MVYAVLPALLPDLPALYAVYFDAFSADPMGRLMLEILFPGSDPASPTFRDEHARATLRFLHASDSQYNFKCVDTRTGALAGIAVGDIHVTERSESDRRFEGASWLSGAERDRADKVLRPLWEMRERLFQGQPHIYAHVAAVSPSHQGHKAGAALVHWGIDLCERTRLPLYLESSPTTRGLYTKMGLQQLSESVVHSAEVLGTPSDVAVPLMVKMPSAAGGLDFYEWIERGRPRFY